MADSDVAWPGNQVSSAERLALQSRVISSLRSAAAVESSGAILVLILLCSAWLAGGSFLLKRQLWMDEVHSWLLLNDPDARHALRALADGADYNPPAWYFTTRIVSAAIGRSTELTLRVLSLFWMMLALCGLYRLLSRQFNRDVSLVAVLLTASHPLLIRQSTEIRSYGFWCAAILWLCNSLQWRPATEWAGRLQWIAIIGLSLVIAECHYFGVLSLGLVATPALLRWKTDRKAALRAVIVVASGCIGFLACLPILSGQRAALSRPTWISPPTGEDSMHFLRALLPVVPIGICLAGVLLSKALRRRMPVTVPGVSQVDDTAALQRAALLRGSLRGLWPCLSLALMPVVIVIVSWSVQPSLVTRYAIVGVPGLAPLFAILLHQCSAAFRGTILFAATIWFGYSVSCCTDAWRADDRERDLLASELLDLPKDIPIVIEDRIIWMALLHRYPEIAGRCWLADFSEDNLAQDSRLRIVQRDVGRRVQKWYPGFSLRLIDSLDGLMEFCVVPYRSGSVHDLRYPAAFTAMRCSPSVFRFTRHERINAASFTRSVPGQH